MKDHWYCQVESEQFGPFTWDQMRAMSAEGRLVPESQVRREADQRWSPASKIPGLLAEAMPAGNSSAGGSNATRFNVADTAIEEATADSSTAQVSIAPEKQSVPVQTMPAAPPAAAKANGQAAAGGLLPGHRAGNGASQKSKISRPTQSQGTSAGSSPASRMCEAPAPPPPPVKKPGGPPKPPLPEPAADVSPLGIVVAPPIAEPARGAKPAGTSGFAAAIEKDAHGLSPLLVGGVLGGIALVLLAIGGGAVAWQYLQKSGDKTAVAAKAAAKPHEEKPAISEAELDAILGPIKPPDPAPAAQQAKTGASPATAPANSAEADTARDENAPSENLSPAERKALAAKKLIAAQPKWTPIEGVVIRGKFTQVQISQIWLASDEKGTRVDPALPPSALAAAGLTAEATARSSPGKYVFVDVRVSNSGETPRKYHSWNNGGNITAILADGKGEPLPLVPPEDTPSVPRLLSLNIPAGEMFGDILVFEAPKEPFESLKLLLSQAAFAAPGRHFALEVPVEFLFKEAEDLPPQTALAADDEAPAEGEPRPTRKMKRDPNGPPSLETLTEQLEAERKLRERQNATDIAPTKDAPSKEVTAKPEKQD